MAKRAEVSKEPDTAQGSMAVKFEVKRHRRPICDLTEVERLEEKVECYEEYIASCSLGIFCCCIINCCLIW